MSISIVVPVYNESVGIDTLCRHLKALGGDCEILFVDGGSQDGTMALLAEQGFRVVRSPQKGRANQMNFGASLAGGDVLWFLHADSIPPPSGLADIRQMVASGCRIGCFPIRFDSRHPLMAVCAALSNLRVRLRNIAFGDQGIFLTASLFQALGGYAPLPLMEDYQLSMDVKKRGISIQLARSKLTTSARRFTAQGRLKTMWRMQWLQHLYRRGGDIEEIARRYNR